MTAQLPTICTNPVFIIGAPRSGTTALAMALSEHSDFWAGEESFFILELFGQGQLQKEYQRWTSRPSNSWLRSQNVTREEFFSCFGLGPNALFTSRSKGKRWIEHTPTYALMADVLALMFPGAYFIHLLRDGRRVVNSMVNISRTFTESARAEMRSGRFLPRWSFDFREACKAWREHSEAAAKLCSEIPDRALTVIHDDLERQPRETCARILRFLGAADEEGPATFIQTNRINSSYATRGGGPPDIPPRPWEQWSSEQHLIFKEEAGSAMARYGFDNEKEEPVSSLKEKSGTVDEGQNENEGVLERIISSKPKLHYWNGEWRWGGLGEHMLRKLFEITSSFENIGGATVLETGAGISTLAFLAAKPRKLISIVSSQDLIDRIKERIQDYSLGSAEPEFYVDRSENVLPELARRDTPFLDVALIDGGHGLPTVFVDFCYANKALKQGGYLAIDDIQLYSVRQLYLLLKAQPGFEIEADLGKLVIFRKTDPKPLLPDFGGQPFVLNNT